MSNKTLSKLKRDELLNLLYEQEKRIEELESKNKQLKAQLEDKRIRISKVGSIADASIALTNIFKEAQKAADLYLENVQGIVREKETAKYVFPVKKEAAKPAEPKPVVNQAAQPIVQKAPVQTQNKAATAKPVPQQKPVVQQKPAQQPKPVVQEKPYEGKRVAKKEDVRIAGTAAKETVTQVKPAEQKPAYVGRHSRGGNGAKK